MTISFCLSALCPTPQPPGMLTPLLLLLLLCALVHPHTCVVQVGVVAIPAAVVSMCGVPLLLSLLGSATADKVVGLYDSCIAPWTTDLLGLFYVPAIAILPVLLCGMQGRSKGLWGFVCGRIWRLGVCRKRGTPFNSGF